MQASTRIVLTIYLLASVIPRAASAADGWFGSMEIGRASYSGLNDVNSPLVYTSIQPKDTSDAYRLAVGYQFTPYVGLEVGYLGVGAARAADFAPGYCIFSNGSTVCIPATGEYTSIKTSGLLAEVTGTVPIAPNWALYARTGLYLDHSVMDLDEAPGLPGPDTETSSRQSTFTYGVGVEWLYSTHYTFRLAWDNYDSLGNSAGLSDPSNTGRYSLRILLLGLVYSF